MRERRGRCKHEAIFTDWVPMPFGPGNCPMESSECQYDGDKRELIGDRCDETCPGYEPNADKED